ncbi:hypothetical protein FE257_010831 [Aspergillus nanangensis]|uniref:GPI inositol-deacylase n=1 Tax=Aspergillus nanangensis TaxID=2582783 RepID=A0AAD4GX71_ASPNN|nr:hypothetical protein FE257_010831 [Aspergillus nanangensis]
MEPPVGKKQPPIRVGGGESSDMRKLSDTSTAGLSIRTTSSAPLSTALTLTPGETDPEPLSPPTLSLRKRFSSAWVQNRRDSVSQDGGGAAAAAAAARGPLGLRLVYSSPEPLIDLIFVHGLRGGSIKTWCKGNDPRFFWPQFWLPMEPGFRNVNIHSFGYDSDWASTKSSILSVQDFGQSLLEEMRNSPHMRDNGSGPVILVGHSMGGLVIKKAFILARDVNTFHGRIKSIFFLATPHRGSDFAHILNNILNISGVGSSRHYIHDLSTSSASAKLINEDFGKYASDIPIFSFYETLRMSMGVTSALIVEKNSAILGPGYKNERIQYLNANHRDICKFDSLDDPNYITLKNALVGSIQDLLREALVTRDEESKNQMKSLRSFLAISDRPDETHRRLDGSCQWIDGRDDFQEWRDSADSFITGDLEEPPDSVQSHSPSIYWVHSNPGTGKTFLASYVVSELLGYQLECAYYYFHISNKASRSLGEFLRSMAYQMALSNAAVRDRLFKLCQEGITFNIDDPWAIWNKVFKKGIFQARVYTSQYWVVDAIDECVKYEEFFTMLKADPPPFPLRIFMTSRKLPGIQRLFRLVEVSATLSCLEIPANDSAMDIERYIESRINNLPVDSPSERQELGQTVLQKSNACFLWVRLVLDELEQVYSKESISQVLRGIPAGMEPYYQRMVNGMAENKLEKHIAKAVLRWVMVSARSMTISQLSQALKLDIDAELPSATVAVEGLCGQLVVVDKSSHLVEIVHPTAREFLLSKGAGEFQISRPETHTKIALVCLKILNSELTSPRNRRFLTQKRPDPSPFLDYAVIQFSEHVYSASSGTDDLLIAMDRFFRTNVLAWVEAIARKGDLHCLIRASKNLKAYLDRRAKHSSPLNSQVRNIDAWSTDLGRLVTKFGACLLQNPTAIHFLIPPLCPLNSAIYAQFGKKSVDGLELVGFRNSAWDDCIASVSLGEDVAAAVSCGDNLIAVGMESGDVNLYNHRSCQKERVLHYTYPVDLVHFADDYVVACTTRFLTLQDLTGRTVWKTRLRFRCIVLTSTRDAVVAVSQHGHVLKWSLADGSLLQDEAFSYRRFDTESESEELLSRAPYLASISPDMRMLALGYRGGSVCLWDLTASELIGWARDEEDRLAAKLLFNPNPNINLLLVIYSNHDLSLYDTWSGDLVKTLKTPNDVGLLSASCSPDGRTLVTTDMQGTMQIWDFESLSLLYHVYSPFPSFRILDFSSDGSSVIDVMDSSMRIWSPSALVRKNNEEDSSVSDDAIHLTATEGQYETHRTSRVTALATHPSLPLVLAGKYNGEVLVFSTKTGLQTSKLYTHSSRSFITELTLGRNNVVASADVTGSIQVWKIVISSAFTVTSSTLLLQTQATSQVKQLCLSESGNHLLVSTSQSDSVYSMHNGQLVGMLEFLPQERGIWRWMAIPGHDEFALFSDHSLSQHSATQFPDRVDGMNYELQYSLPEGNQASRVNTAIIDPVTCTVAIEIQHRTEYAVSSTAYLFDVGAKSKEAGATLPPVSPMFSTSSRHFLGISSKTKSMVFLHRNAWVSSIEQSALASDRYTQHFFVPNEYIATDQEVLPAKSADDDIIFCLYGELVIVRNGLKFQNVVGFEETAINVG